jgi:5-methyltetrahydrofolate--homocysteine methyltransferase
MTRCFDFTEADWQRIEADWTAWWQGCLQRPLVTITTRDPDSYPEPGDDFLTRFPPDMPAQPVIDYFDRQLQHVHYYGDAFPRFWINFGAGIAAAFLGAGAHYNPPTTWFHPLPASSAAGIHLAYDPDNVWWRRVQDMTRAAVRCWNGRLVVAYTDLGGNLDILASLRGTQNLLFDVIDAPEEVDRLVNEITTLWLRYFNELEAMLPPEQHGRAAWAPLWCPATGYMLQSDFGYMISPDMFERFVLPDLIACCDAMDYPFYHMDGKGQLAHLDMLLSIPKLRGVQWQPGDGQPLADHWLEVLRRIRDAGKLCQVFVTLDGALKITRESGGKGFLFDIMDHDQTILPEQADAFFEELERLK